EGVRLIPRESRAPKAEGQADQGHAEEGRVGDDEKGHGRRHDPCRKRNCHEYGSCGHAFPPEPSGSTEEAHRIRDRRQAKASSMALPRRSTISPIWSSVT